MNRSLIRAVNIKGYVSDIRSLIYKEDNVFIAKIMTTNYKNRLKLCIYNPRSGTQYELPLGQVKKLIKEGEDIFYGC